MLDFASCLQCKGFEKFQGDINSLRRGWTKHAASGNTNVLIDRELGAVI